MSGERTGPQVARGLLELTRPGNAVAAGVLTFTGAFVAAGLEAAPVAVIAAVLATVLATAAGNAINDYFDREIDSVNRPKRPIPRGAVTPRQALVFSAGLFLLAVGATLVLPLIAIAIAVANLVALIAYTEVFKGLPGVGNVVVAYLTGSTFLFGAAAVRRLADPAVLVLFVLAGLATMTREIVKDVEDVAGDREDGLRTLPLVVGEETAIWIGALVMVIATLASAIPYLMGTFGAGYLALVIPADGVMLRATVRSFSDPKAAQRRLKQGMFLATAAFLVGRSVAVVGAT
ncbi:MAG: geranylgeranylglycerol-phosphate geranylgeranyltransferase [Haloquadratum sp.]